MKVIEMLKKFWREDEGLTMVEYALVGSLVVVVSIAAFQLLGSRVSNKASALAVGIGT